MTDVTPSPAALEEIKPSEHRKLIQILGPGLITGASDDDPSGIATYSQVGAQFGYGIGWTLLVAYPLMCAIQQISAEIGRVTGHGLAGNLRRYYPALDLYGLIGLLVIANTINHRCRSWRHGGGVEAARGWPRLALRRPVHRHYRRP